MLNMGVISYIMCSGPVFPTCSQQDVLTVASLGTRSATAQQGSIFILPRHINIAINITMLNSQRVDMTELCILCMLRSHMNLEACVRVRYQMEYAMKIYKYNLDFRGLFKSLTLNMHHYLVPLMT